MKRRESDKEAWETPSLEWVHRVRRERQSAREGRPPRPLTRGESEKLAKRYGLELARKSAAGRDLSG